VNNDTLITTKLTHWIYFNIHVFGIPSVEIRYAISICPHYIFRLVTAADSADPRITNCSLNITTL